jgi:hypothetical protein
MLNSFDDYKKLLNSEPEGERYYEMLIISHSAMSQTYNLVIDSAPLTALNGVEFRPANVKPSKPINGNDLDQTASFTIGDEFNELDGELDRIPLDTAEKIVCRSVIVVSTDLDSPVEDISFYVDSIPQQKGAFTIKSSVTDLNLQQTGEAMTLTRLPALAGI